MTTATTKTLAEMTMGELVAADIANSNRIECWNDLYEILPSKSMLARRREIRAEIDRRKAEAR